ncbi:hypothetical protein CL638_01445 [bacterium]|nr:hypothetical protein [bacterium]
MIEVFATPHGISVNSCMPIFPEFAPVNLASSTIINNHTSRFEPYSDFNFISLWSWDTAGERKYSILNDNLVILFTDYTTEEPFLSLLGDKKVDESVEILLSYSEKNNLPNELRLVPEVVVKNLSNEFVCYEDENNNDYIFSTEKIRDYAGNKYKNKRQLKNKFENTYSNAVLGRESASSATAQVKVFELLQKWANNKQDEQKDFDLKHEQSAILRALKAADNDLKVLLTTLHLDDKIIAFSIDEVVSEGYAISHFFKTDHEHIGCTEFFNSELAALLHNEKIIHWNWEQDLGLQALKDVKNRYRPVSYLKKFVLRRTE